MAGVGFRYRGRLDMLSSDWELWDIIPILLPAVTCYVLRDHVIAILTSPRSSVAFSLTSAYGRHHS
jgi:hypothetical protein